MANTISAVKRVRQTERRTEVNQKNKSQLRHAIRALRRAITAKEAYKDALRLFNYGI